MGKKITDILIVVLLAVIMISGYRLWKMFSEYHESDKQYEETAKRHVHKKDPDNTMSEYGPQVCPITVDFDSLLEENKDVVGWIYSEDTPINYPVLRGETNDTYLYHMIDGRYNSAGSIFMDTENKPDLSDFNTILYGHHMKNGSMFASLHKYKKQEYYDEHKFMWYLTPKHVYRLDVMFGFVENSDAAVYQIFAAKKQLYEFLSYAQTKSDFVPEHIQDGINGVIVLSTCTYEYNDARYIVVCAPVMVE